MKKLLALVMALVMTLGLATVGANAAYADAADINYKEAVDVMTAIGVLGGDESGFRPAETLKRSEGAKIIAYLLLGNKTAEALSGTGAKFTDVPANHWAAGYIEYLASEGVLGGKGNGIFDPDGDLTTTQFAKMLLVALGYDAAIEGYGGTDWAINVQKQATKLGLFDGNSDAVGSAAIKREEAALYALNTLKTPIVEYETKGTKIEVNGASITTGASNATYRLNTGKALARYDQIDQLTTNVTGGGTSQIIEFAEEYYSKLILNNSLGDGAGDDSFGRPANEWYFDGKKIGNYGKTADQVYTAKVEYGKIYKDLGLTRDTATTEYLIDNEYHANITLKKDSTTELGGNGTETYVYYNEGAVSIYEINWYAGDVTGVYAATASKDAYVSITTRGGGFSGDKKTTSFAVDDVVIYTVSNPNGVGTTLGSTKSASIQSVEKAETITGKLSAYVAGDNLTVDGTKYSYSNKVSNEATTTVLRNTSEVSVVLDKYGYAIDVDEDIVMNYAIVAKVNNGLGSWGDAVQVNLVLTDGTTTGAKTVDSDCLNASNTLVYGANYTKIADNDIEVGDIVSYVVGSDGKVMLTQWADAKVYNDSGTADDMIENGSATLGQAFGVATAAARKANSKTVFILRTGSSAYKAFTGIANVPTVTTNGDNANVLFNSFVKSGSAAATVVYVDAYANASAITNEAVFVVFDPDIGPTVDEKIGTYYEYDAVVNGTPQKLKVSTTTYNAVIQPTTGTAADVLARHGAYLFTSISYNSDDVATLKNAVTATTTGGKVVTGTTAATTKDKSIGLGGVTYPYADSVKVFFINEDDELSASSIGAIGTSEGNRVWFKLNSSNEVTYIFWQKAAGYTYTAANLTTAPQLKAIQDVLDAYNDAGNIRPVTITINGDLTLNDTNTATYTAPLHVYTNETVVINGNLTINGTASQNYLINEGTVTIKSTKTSDGDLYVTSGNVNATAGSITIDGRVIVGAGGDITNSTDSTIAVLSTGSQNIINGSSLVINGGTVTMEDVLVLGHLTVTGGTFTVKSITADSGADVSAVTAKVGTVTPGNTQIAISGGAVTTNELTVTTANSVTISGGSVDTGALTVAAGQTVAITGAQTTVTVEDTTTLNGTITVNTSSSSSTSLGDVVVTDDTGANALTVTAGDVAADTADPDVSVTGTVAVTTPSFTLDFSSFALNKLTDKTGANGSTIEDVTVKTPTVAFTPEKAEVKGSITVDTANSTATGTKQGHSNLVYLKSGDTVVLKVTVGVKAAAASDGIELSGELAYYKTETAQYKITTAAKSGDNVVLTVEKKLIDSDFTS